MPVNLRRGYDMRRVIAVIVDEGRSLEIKPTYAPNSTNQKAKAKIPSTQHPIPNPQAEVEAEACFHKAIEIARKQQAQS